jgi:hypothetical protein
MLLEHCCVSIVRLSTTADTATAQSYCNKSIMRLSIQISMRLCIRVHKGYNDGFITPRLSATADTADTAETVTAQLHIRRYR